MSTVTPGDGTEVHYKDWGKGQAVIFSHDRTLSADSFEDRTFFLASHSPRCVAHDRRGHGRSGQSWQGNDPDTYADDLAALAAALDLKTRFTSTTMPQAAARWPPHRAPWQPARSHRAVLIGAITPPMPKTQTNADLYDLPIVNHPGFGGG